MSTAAERKRWRIAREQGRPARMKGPEVEKLAERLRSYHSRGMPYRAMSEQSGVAQSTISVLLKQKGGMTRRNYDRLSRVRFAESDGLGARKSPVGAVRRIRALWAAGYTLEFLTQQLGGGNAQLCRMLRGNAKRTHADYDERIAALYRKFSEQDPVAAGVSKQGSTLARNQGSRLGYPPPHCWDADTIDNPDAIPEWTGACGTAEGLRIHQREGIPACPACQNVNLGPAAGALTLNPVKLQEAREALGLSLIDIGRALGVHNTTVHYWESGRSAPRSRSLTDRYLAVIDLNPEDAV